MNGQIVAMKVILNKNVKDTQRVSSRPQNCMLYTTKTPNKTTLLDEVKRNVLSTVNIN